MNSRCFRSNECNFISFSCIFPCTVHLRTLFRSKFLKIYNSRIWKIKFSLRFWNIRNFNVTIEFSSKSILSMALVPYPLQQCCVWTTSKPTDGEEFRYPKVSLIHELASILASDFLNGISLRILQKMMCDYPLLTW